MEINRVETKVGAAHTLEHVLLAHDGKQLQVGRPYLKDAKVVCEVVEHRRGPKVISYHFRRRENWRKTVGHRQPLSRLVVKEILVSGDAVKAEPKAKAQAPKADTAKTATRAPAAKKSATAKTRKA